MILSWGVGLHRLLICDILVSTPEYGGMKMTLAELIDSLGRCEACGELTPETELVENENHDVECAQCREDAR